MVLRVENTTHRQKKRLQNPKNTGITRAQDKNDQKFSQNDPKPLDRNLQTPFQLY